MQEFDVVVLGTGAAGLTAAIAAHEGGARVGLFEKAETVGGTSAWSGGQLWIPNNVTTVPSTIPATGSTCDEVGGWYESSRGLIHMRVPASRER
jgi:glycine/D-amino acid oxidase-like deaminating enzyme